MGGLMRGLCLALGLATPAYAEGPMTPEEFEAWSTGFRLDYTVDGVFWGSEAHLPGRETRDADDGGACVTGAWTAVDGAICFAYDGNPGPHCWRFRREGGTVLAELDGGSGGVRIEVTRTTEPLACQGPEVGV